MIVVDNKEVKNYIIYNGNKYFLKSIKDNNLLNELLGMKLAKLIGIKSAKYEVALINGVKMIASKDIEGDGVYIPGDLFLDKDNSLYDIWWRMDEVYDNTEYLMWELVKVYIFDLITMNFDRNSGNWGVKDNKELWIFDNEFIFSREFIPYLTSSYEYTELLEESFAEYLKRTILEIKNFMKISSSEFIYELDRQLGILDINTITSLVKEVEVIADMKYSDYRFIEDFKLLHDELKSLVLEKNLIR